MEYSSHQLSIYYYYGNTHWQTDSSTTHKDMQLATFIIGPRNALLYSIDTMGNHTHAI